MRSCVETNRCSAIGPTETHNLDFHTGEFVQLMGRIRRGEARDKDYDRLNKVGAKKHADDAEPTVRARRLIVFDSV